jgi:hypothetical protein
LTPADRRCVHVNHRHEALMGADVLAVAIALAVFAVILLTIELLDRI